MLARLRRLFSRERDLRMVWEVARDGRRSHLIGSMHFFPYHFRGALRRSIGEAAVVLIEGPVDDQAMRKVIEAGSGETSEPLLDRLDAETERRIRSALGDIPLPLSGYELYLEMLDGELEHPLAAEIKGMKPWLAFLHIWNRYRARCGWAYSMELDAVRIAAELGKPVRALETIEEQIEALGGIPLERIVSFLRSADWDGYAQRSVRNFLEGDLESLLAGARVFPTFCESIVERRDPVLFGRMIPYLESGGATVLVGVLHLHALIPMLRAAGFAVRQLAAP